MRAFFFHHGDTHSQHYNRSLWREYSLALHLIKYAISPFLSLAECIKNWGNISEGLAEPPRKRMQQINMLHH
jgi:hypothetical protein